MAHHLIFILSSLLVALVAFQGTQAVEYEVTNDVGETPGGTRFNNEIGVDYSKQVLESASIFIWQIFRQSTYADRKNVSTVEMIVETNPPEINSPVEMAYTSKNVIYVNATYIAGYSENVSDSENLKSFFTGIIYHEVTHIWQWKGKAPGGLIEGIADYVRLKANYIQGKKPERGDEWDSGYGVTALFLEYCNSLKDGFVADLNGKMRTGYSDDFFEELLGKPVDQLWSDYKTSLGG